MPGRAYHNLTHIAHCLTELDHARAALERSEEAEVAVWYHDAVYIPGAADNERLSAELADGALRHAGVRDEARARITHMILATDHRPPAPHGDAALVVDADLSILGADPADFDAYEAAIRTEYAAVPEADFRAGRAAVLRTFLDRPRIFATDAFRERHEAQARANLARSLIRLTE